MRQTVGKPGPVQSRAEVRLVRTSDPVTDLKPGAEGTVDFVDDVGTVHIQWDNGSNLGMIPGEDVIEPV